MNDFPFKIYSSKSIHTILYILYGKTTQPLFRTCFPYVFHVKIYPVKWRPKVFLNLVGHSMGPGNGKLLHHVATRGSTLVKLKEERNFLPFSVEGHLNSTRRAFFDRRVLIMLYLIRVGKGNVDHNQLSFRFYQRVLLIAQTCNTILRESMAKSINSNWDQTNHQI